LRGTRHTHAQEALKTKTELREINCNKRGEEVFGERGGVAEDTGA